MAASPEDLRTGEWKLLIERGHTVRDRDTREPVTRSHLGGLCLIRARGTAQGFEYAVPLGYLLGRMFYPFEQPDVASAFVTWGQPPAVSIEVDELSPEAGGAGVRVHFLGPV